MANRETQVPLINIIVGNPNALASQVPQIIAIGGNPNNLTTQVCTIVIVPNDGNSTPPGGTLVPIQEFLMP